MMDFTKNLLDKAKRFYTNRFAPEREETIKELTNLRDEIQRDKYNDVILSLIYHGCSLGVLGVLTYIKDPIYAALLITFPKLTRSTYEDVTKTLIRRKIYYVEECLEKHEGLCCEMNEYLRKLKKREIKLFHDKINQLRKGYDIDGVSCVQKNSSNMDYFNCAIQLSAYISPPTSIINMLQKGSFKFSMTFDFDFMSGHGQSLTEFASKYGQTANTALGIIFGCQHIKDIRLDIDSLMNYGKGRLCFEAGLVNAIIKQMQDDDAYLKEELLE